MKLISVFKKIIIVFAVVFVVLFYVGGYSFKYMDWQYYKFKKMIERESGIYIYDKALYDEIEYLRKEKNGGVYFF